MRVVRDQAQRRKEVLSSPQFILNNHLSSVNKQVAEQSSKGLFKRHLKNFNCLGFFILKFIKQIFFKFNKPYILEKFQVYRNSEQKVQFPSTPSLPTHLHSTPPSFPYYQHLALM